MQGHKHSKGMSKSETGLQNPWSGETGMEQGKSARVRHTEFQETDQRVKVRMENRKVMDTKQGSWKRKQDKGEQGLKFRYGVSWSVTPSPIV